MTTFNSVAASQFFNQITEQYDARYPKGLIPAFMDPDSLRQKANEYNQTENMTQWYQTINNLRPLNHHHLSNPQTKERRRIEISAVHFSAMKHLTALDPESTYLLPKLADHIDEFEPGQAGNSLRSFIAISNPKSELDTLVFRKVVCSVSSAKLGEILGEMETACTQLGITSFWMDHWIYALQGGVAFVCPYLKIRQIFCAAVILTPIFFVYNLTHRIYLVVMHALDAQWKAVVNQYPDVSAISRLNTIYHKLKVINNWTTSSLWKVQVIGFVFSQVKPSTAALSRFFPPLLDTAYYIIYPKTIFTQCANRFMQAYMLKPALVAFKIFNGTEYQTVQALKERFKDDPVYYERALNAHALWMRLQQIATPEECLAVMGLSTAPAA